MTTHLKGFGLENFRVFKDYTWFDFAPITVLTGPNNSGKSSLLKAFLLLKDNFDKGLLPPKFDSTYNGYSDNRIVTDMNENGFVFSEATIEPSYPENFDPKSLEFNGNIHGLNSPKGTKFRGGSNNEIYFEIPYEVNKKTLIYKLTFKIDSKKDEAIINSKIEIFDSNSSYKKSVLRIEPHCIFFDINLYNEIVNERNKILNIPNNNKNLVCDSFGLSFQYWFSDNQFEEDSQNLAKKVLKAIDINENIDNSYSCKGIENYFNRIDYWASSQNEQKRIYTESDSSKFKQLLVDFHKAYQNPEVKNIFEGLAKHFGIQGEIGSLFNREQGSYFPNIDGLALTNFGYGYTQLVSLFIKLMVHADKNRENYNGDTFEHDSIIMLEEPEINLHPNLQSKLADLFSSISKQTNTQFLIETHSEYMIRKFQYLILKAELRPEDIVIYYFKDPNDTSDEPLIKKINIQKNGRLTGNFGKGFLDETGRLMASLLTGEYLN
jgi:predicted ATP-dependent endonuclease of OLD family